MMTTVFLPTSTARWDQSGKIGPANAVSSESLLGPQPSGRAQSSSRHAEAGYSRSLSPLRVLDVLATVPRHAKVFAYVDSLREDSILSGLELPDGTEISHQWQFFKISIKLGLRH